MEIGAGSVEFQSNYFASPERYIQLLLKGKGTSSITCPFLINKIPITKLLSFQASKFLIKFIVFVHCFKCHIERSHSSICAIQIGYSSCNSIRIPFHALHPRRGSRSNKPVPCTSKHMDRQAHTRDRLECHAHSTR
jgi:hypothetical protein